MPGSTLFSLCKKTQLCKFHQIGACTKGEGCTFAHGYRELLERPDLSSTKVCPRLIAGGSCDDDKCQFAHSKSQLRRLTTPQTQAKASRQPSIAKFATMQEKVTLLEPVLASRMILRTRSLDEATECPTQEVLTDNSSIWSLSFTSTDGGCATRQTSVCEEVEPEVESGKLESSDTIKENGRVVKNMFHKTRMCTFYAHGRCKKRRSCNFAHSPEELMPLPKLSHTKLCPQLLNAGRCDKDGCTFAHCEEELQPRQRAPLKSMKRVLVDKERGGSCAGWTAGGTYPDLASQEIPWGRTMTEDSDSREIPWGRRMTEDPSALRTTGLIVRNTFIDFEDPELRKPHSRSHSAPGRLCCNLAQPDEVEEAAMQRVMRSQHSRQTWAPAAVRSGLDQQQPCMAIALCAVPDTFGVPALTLPCLQ